MINFRKTAAFAAAVVMSALLIGCSAKTDSGSSTAEQTESQSEKSSETVKKELTEDEKTAASEAEISADRYCTDNTEITQTAEKLLTSYYEGITEADHDKCFDNFPSFYKKAMEDENKEYNETNEEYMQSIRDGLIETYGEDFYIFPEVTSVLQINDSSMADLQERINTTFKTDIVLDDLYYIYCTENARGSVSKSSNAFEYCLLYTGGNYYLYDDYFESYDTSVSEDTADTADTAEISDSSEAAEETAEE